MLSGMSGTRFEATMRTAKKTNANQKCVLAGDKQTKEKDAPPFSDIDKAPISNDSSIAKKDCTPSGG